MIVVDLSARATTIHHDDGFRAERPHSITSRRDAGLVELPTSELGQHVPALEEARPGPEHGSRQKRSFISKAALHGHAVGPIVR